MRLITKNFRLGFGSFIDKKVMPFVDPRKEKQVNPPNIIVSLQYCKSAFKESPCSEGCAPTYGLVVAVTFNMMPFDSYISDSAIK